ncbi:unnamed protein product [Timema podura]|uniref:Uncharacterized protein n=1 Tax=Timema podura TaxID=61482 RepID=A0ABN7PNR3_TIMPD|nr:unnamed protein product [Timema podura]
MSGTFWTHRLGQTGFPRRISHENYKDPAMCLFLLFQVVGQPYKPQNQRSRREIQRTAKEAAYLCV